MTPFIDVYKRQAEYSGREIALMGQGSRFTFFHGNEPVTGAVDLQSPGRHNVSNAVAAMTVAAELGLNLERCAGALKDFRGAKRRFETVGVVNGITIIAVSYTHLDVYKRQPLTH